MTPTTEPTTGSVAVDVTTFPADFLWGAATAAYQIEGAVAEGGRSPSIWDVYSHREGAIRNGDTGDVACDHYHRWEPDFDLAHDLGLGAYRLSVSWPRLQPRGVGALNPVAVEFYRRQLTDLRNRGIRPFVTLYHFDLPQILERQGGWPNRATAERFAEFARRTVDALGDLAKDWVTLNEPWCSAFNGYYEGTHAPGRRNLRDGVAAAHHLNLAHGLAVRSIREGAYPDVRIGLTNLVTEAVAATDRPEDVQAAERVDANNNLMFLAPAYSGRYPELVRSLYADQGLDDLIRRGDLQAISSETDFVGLNHYHRLIVSADPGDRHLGARWTHAEPTTTTMGWSFAPQAFENVLRRIPAEFTNLPIYITESGGSFNDHVAPNGKVEDPERVRYLTGYLNAAAKAIESGVDIAGYFVWSLLDNFEWGEGYSKRFGLIYIDYATQERTPKSSAVWYRLLIERHAALATEPEDESGGFPKGEGNR
ncbi:beta-glucosidase [hydrothermal vent metagenome]|uniref:beta-glucosidase n=1 Tax=hydrothermal vent metagenome TaxID=652676 RepID=A0A3B0S329_9ZZZZ